MLWFDSIWIPRLQFTFRINSSQRIFRFEFRTSPHFQLTFIGESAQRHIDTYGRSLSPSLSHRLRLSRALAAFAPLKYFSGCFFFFLSMSLQWKCSLIHCFVVLLPHSASHTLRACIHRRPSHTVLTCVSMRVCAYVVTSLDAFQCRRIPALNLSIVLSLSSSESFRADANSRTVNANPKKKK